MLSNWAGNPNSDIYHNRLFIVVAIGGMGRRTN